MTSIEEIEQIIKPLLLFKVTFSIDNKVIKQGKMQLFCIKDFFCIFTLLGLEKETKKTLYELPYPFGIKAYDNTVEFDYTVDSFCLSNVGIKEHVGAVKLTKTSKFFNKKVIATFN
jgi:hypothetical protein